MYPEILKIGPFVISSFGLMLVVAFMTCNYLLKKEVVASGYDESVAEDITFRAAIGGILGAKLYYIIENIPSGRGIDNINGLVQIIKGIFTLNIEIVSIGIQNFGAGLVYLGGFIGGLLAVTIYIKKNNLNWLEVSDWVAPMLLLGHGIGRIGCFLVGDDYGIPTNLPWGVSFPNGLPPTTTDSFSSQFPWVDISGCTPGLVSVHPTQIYEMSLYFIIFFFIKFRKRNQSFKGELFCEYLFLGGLARFLVEFLRTNQPYLFELSGAQIISIIMMTLGIYFINRFKKSNI